MLPQFWIFKWEKSEDDPQIKNCWNFIKTHTVCDKAGPATVHNLWFKDFWSWIGDSQFCKFVGNPFPIADDAQLFWIKQLESLSNGRRKVRLNLFINLWYCFESRNEKYDSFYSSANKSTIILICVLRWLNLFKLYIGETMAVLELDIIVHVRRFPMQERFLGDHSNIA